MHGHIVFMDIAHEVDIANLFSCTVSFGWCVHFSFSPPRSESRIPPLPGAQIQIPRAAKFLYLITELELHTMDRHYQLVLLTSYTSWRASQEWLSSYISWICGWFPESCVFSHSRNILPIPVISTTCHGTAPVPDSCPLVKSKKRCGAIDMWWVLLAEVGGRYVLSGKWKPTSTSVSYDFEDGDCYGTLLLWSPYGRFFFPL